MSSVEPLSPLPDEYVPSSDEINVAVDWSGVEKRVKALWEKAKELYAQTKERLASPKPAKKETTVPKEDDGILTHELDE